MHTGGTIAPGSGLLVCTQHCPFEDCLMPTGKCSCVCYSLRALFIALNDEAVAVRVRAIQAVGRLAAHNPAYVMPALRKHLMQLLSDMSQAPESRQREGAWSRSRHAELLTVLSISSAMRLLPLCSLAVDRLHCSGGLTVMSIACMLQSAQQDPTWNVLSCWPACAESASLLEMLICACPPLVLPYVPPILRALVAKLRAAVNQQQQAHHVATGGSTHGPPAGRSAWQPQGYSLAPAGAMWHHAHVSGLLPDTCRSAGAHQQVRHCITYSYRLSIMPLTLGIICLAHRRSSSLESPAKNDRHRLEKRMHVVLLTASAHHVCLIRTEHRQPQAADIYLSPGSGALMGPLGSGGGTGAAEGGVIASVLATTGALARVAGPLLRPHVNDIVPLIIDALQDPGEGPKRHVAVLTLGQASP